MNELHVGNWLQAHPQEGVSCVKFPGEEPKLVGWDDSRHGKFDAAACEKWCAAYAANKAAEKAAADKALADDRAVLEAMKDAAGFEGAVARMLLKTLQ